MDHDDYLFFAPPSSNKNRRRKFGGLAIPLRGTHDFAPPPYDGFAFSVWMKFSGKPDQSRAAVCQIQGRP
jgi:hypothetical protein